MESNSGIWVPSGKYIEMQEELKDLRARLAQRHFFGKVYDVTAESINQLAGELDAANEEISDLYGIRAAINDENHQLKEDLMEANKIIEHLNAQITIDTARIRDLVETVQEERDNQKAMDTTRLEISTLPNPWMYRIQVQLWPAVNGNLRKRCSSVVSVHVEVLVLLVVV